VDGWIGKTQLDGFIQGIQGRFLYKIATFDGGIESKEDKDKQRYKWIKLRVDRGEIKRSWAKFKRERGRENGGVQMCSCQGIWSCLQIQRDRDIQTVENGIRRVESVP
jgi:hypothetical protein